MISREDLNMFMSRMEGDKVGNMEDFAELVQIFQGIAFILKHGFVGFAIPVHPSFSINSVKSSIFSHFALNFAQKYIFLITCSLE